MPGEFVSITGPSGSGKSSLLYLLGLLDRPTGGTIAIHGEDTAPYVEDDLAALRLARIGFVFQFHFLLPEFSAFDNVLVPMRKLGRWGEDEARDRAAKLLSDVGLADQMRKRPDQMSGGQRQRVAIARSMANDPDIVFADEPTGSLDQKNGQIVFEIFARLASDFGKSVVTVTHDAHLAAQTHRQIHLVDGRIVDDGNGRKRNEPDDRTLPAPPGA
ncbi:MAG: ABC transporter ATP-binding protein [Rhodospirillaceae bacterium]|nr:ABC transporter ATP-binding protein [Rhodospirillaceae bacterium]